MRPGLELLLAHRDTPGTIEVTTVNHQFNLAPIDVHAGEGRGARGQRGHAMAVCLPRRIRDNEMELPVVPEYPATAPMDPLFHVADAFSFEDVARR